MNFIHYLSNPLNQHFLSFALVLLAFLICGASVYLVRKATKITENSVNIVLASENNLKILESIMTSGDVFSRALINTTQTKGSIELCNILLSYCRYKSELLTHKAVENSLSVEISNAVVAIEALEEKRALLENKLRQAYEQLNPKNPLAELNQLLVYAQALQHETEMEFANTEKMKMNVLKVNEVLDDVLLQLQ